MDFKLQYYCLLMIRYLKVLLFTKHINIVFCVIIKKRSLIRTLDLFNII